MHTADLLLDYRDAIRRSEGAYVLYPGLQDEAERKPWRGFHELLPGLGAFAVRPGKDGEAIGMEKVGSFLDDVINQLTNRATQLAQKRYHQSGETLGGNLKVEEPKAVTLVNQIIQEVFAEDINRAITVPAHELVVLSGVVKDEAHRSWIESNKLYNFRSDEGEHGFLPVLAPRYAEACLILLRNPSGDPLPGLWRVVSSVENWSRIELSEIDYPEAAHENYAVYQIEPVAAVLGHCWSQEKLSYLQDQALPAEASPTSPFQFTLKELMAAY